MKPLEPQEIRSNIRRAIHSSFRNRTRTSIAIFLSGLVFILMNLVSRPVFSYQILSSNPLLLLETVKLSYLYNSTGLISNLLTLSYAALAGPVLVNLGLQIRNHGTGVSKIGGIAPGLIVSGCLGCGAGLLGLLGLTGALALLPFQGSLITLTGILLMLYFFYRSGDPEICEID